jgi:predicted double-glycine peptidase
MVLDFLCNALKDESPAILPSFEVGDIAQIIGTTEAGTPLENVKNLNKDEKILKAIPSIEFEDKFMSNLSEIEAEINENRPIIVWVLLSIDSRRYVHSVVITGVDVLKQRVYYNDPIFGQKEEQIGAFMRMWDGVDRTLIKVKIGKREQRLLDEWLRMRQQEGGVSQ